jgi:hypothetical protein
MVILWLLHHILRHNLLLMIAFLIDLCSVHVIIHKALSLEEVLPSLLLLDLLLTLVQALLLLLLLLVDHPILELLDQANKLHLSMISFTC